jgi:prepilin-type N-terminal cleavage/methylation domain-containing protein
VLIIDKTKIYKKANGFSIVELLVVIVIIGILAAITFMSYSGIVKQVAINTLKNDLGSAAIQLEKYSANNGAYPTDVSAINNNSGLEASSDTTYQYTYTNSTNYYCLTASNKSAKLSYYISSDNKVPQKGACSGQTDYTASSSYTVQIYAWGGGGGGSSAGGDYSGGAGGAASGIATLSAGIYPVVVGDGGASMGANTGTGGTVAGGGGFAGILGFAGQGGGYSGVFSSSISQSKALLVAGGGGGGGYNGTGGAGGGSAGIAGTGNNSGTGANQTVAGANPYGGTGSALQGGTSSTGNAGDNGGGGGGGGGYFGGGAGFNGDSPAGNSAGGGGSGYYNSAYFSSSATLTAGSGTTPGDSSNSLRGAAGNGGTGVNAGNSGIVVIKYLSSSMTATGGTITYTDSNNSNPRSSGPYSGGYTIHTFASSGTFTIQ